MKKLKIILVFASLLFIDGDLFGQNENYFHINAGYVGTTYRYIETVFVPWTAGGIGPVIPIEIKQSLNGISAGVGYNLHIKKIFRIDFGLDYHFFWTKEKYVKTSFLQDSCKFHILNFPIELSIHVDINDDWAFLAFVKPTFSCGLSRKSGKIQIDGVPQKLDYHTQLDMNRCNFYLGPGIGFKFKGIILKGGVEWPVYKVLKEAKIRQSQYYVKLAYAF